MYVTGVSKLRKSFKFVKGIKSDCKIHFVIYVECLIGYAARGS